MKSMMALTIFLAGSLAHGVDEVGSIGDTTKMERRVEARNYSVFSIGPVGFNNLGTDQSGQAIKVGHIWETTPYAAVKATGHGAFASGDADASIVAGTMGANFYFTKTHISPFVGFDFGYGGATSSAEDVKDVAGWTLGANVGLAMFRTSSVQMHLDANYLHVFADNNKGEPSQVSASLGILF